jgi:predicted Na+-dependent transporter
MGSLIIAELEKIKNPIIKAFAFRFYNVFKSVVLPLVLGIILRELKEHGNFAGLMEEKVWQEVLFTIVLTLVGSAAAGLEKVSRMESK